MNFYALAFFVLVPSGLAFDVQVTEIQESSSVSGSFPNSMQTSCGRDKDCIDDDKEFRKTCQRFNGQADGARCFFRTGSPTTMDQAWKACENQGAGIAQIHTSSEFLAIQKIHKKITMDIQSLDLISWIALKRNFLPLEPGTQQGVKHATWFDNSTYSHPQLSVQNTFIRRYLDQLSLRIQVECHMLRGINNFLDQGCTYPMTALCMLTNRAQTFNLVDNLCIAEEPIEIRNEITPQECADECSRYKWCRSFNYYDDNSCYMFTWSWKDLTQDRLVYGTKSCRHYSYKS